VLVAQETVSEELKSRLQAVMKATPNTAERSCLQEVLALLENWDCRVHDSATAVNRRLISGITD
jgi:ABC-type phosphate/phosphonate transport system substrate-binding protein